MEPTGPLRGRAGLITGGTSGIGAATAVRLTSLGARVAVLARKPSPASDVFTATERLGNRAVSLLADVADNAEVHAAFEAAVGRLGRLDFVVANAGAGEQSSIADGDPALWRTVLATNLLGVAHTARAALTELHRGGGGDLVVVASVAGRQAYAGEPAYVASKWGVVGLGRLLRSEGARYGVRVTVIEPGLVDTPLTHASATVEGWLHAVEPLTARDVADAIAFAISQPPGVVVDEMVLRPQQQQV